MTKQLGYDQASSTQYMWLMAREWTWVIVGMDDTDTLQVYCANDPNDATQLNLTKIQCQPIEQYIKNIIE